MVVRITILIIAAAALCGCGYLSNDPFYEGGFGTVSGRLVADGRPVQGSLVFVMRDEIISLTTGPDGGFSLKPVPAGRGRALVAVWGSNLGLQEHFDLPSSGELDLGELTLKPLALLEGEVDLPDPQLAEVAVLQTPFVARPDQNGRFSLLLPGGSWDLEVRAAGYLPEPVGQVTTRSGESAALAAAVRPGMDEAWECQDGVVLTERFYQGGQGTVDVLFVVDNSGSMVGEQEALGNSFEDFAHWLEIGLMDYRITVVTSGMESIGCPPCNPPSIPGSCMNETGENGRFQDRICQNQGTVDDPVYACQSDPSCRVVDETNLACFYEETTREGIVFVGVKGCGYERGLAAMRRALSLDLLDTYNQGFLRPGARLAVIVVSDEEDCGEVGDVSESLGISMGDVCYYAAKGVGPEGETVHPDDPEQKPYRLTPVSAYAGFLWDLKPGPGLVTFSAIVGVTDPQHPRDTTIEYSWDDQQGRWNVEDACVTPGCTGNYCFAKPGTRYIELASLTGGAVESICQTNFSEPMERVVGESTGFRRTFVLGRAPLAPDDILVSVDGVPGSGWQWVEARQAVVFDDDSIPAPYSLIEIEYPIRCP